MKRQTLETVAALVRAAIPDTSERNDVLALLERGFNPVRKDKMLKPREACEVAGVTRKTLRIWERKGYIHPQRISKYRIRWSRNELERFANGCVD